ncbi:MAG TPA: hypothetical protein VF041_07345 [Gemmatimonadaceae bacterium]
MRVASLALVAWMVRAALAPGGRRAAARMTASGALADSLRAWTLDARAESLHVTLDATPTRGARAWLAALARAGAVVRWSARGLAPLAVAREDASDPAGGGRVLVAGPTGRVVHLRDAAGMLDSVRLASGAWEVRAPALVGRVVATLGASEAVAAPGDSLAGRAVVVLGRAGWEGKFVVAALEERGWPVAARLVVAPGVSVAQGSLALDTARVAAVVALDTSAARDAARIARFVREGGGVVLAGDAARAPALARLAAGRVGERVRAASLSLAGADPRRALGFWSIGPLAPDAVPLESRDGRVAAAARRLGAGRVVQVGYDETWRWRLGGDAGAPEAHRAWWAGVVASAAYRASVPRAAAAADRAEADPAPFAATVSAIGAPTTPPPSPAVPTLPRGLEWWMLALLFLLLAGEWLSRRARGAP